jgi:ribonuclease P protein component
MIPRQHRIIRKDFPSPLDKRSVLRLGFLTVSRYPALPLTSQNHASVVVAKKQYARAVDRHRIRRMVYRAFMELGLSRPSGEVFCYIVVVHKTSPFPTYLSIYHALESVFET